MSSRAEQNADPRMDDITPDGRCLCRGCGEFFNSTKSFTLHRYQIEPGKTRGCHDKQWMLNKDWSLNRKGFWITQSRAADSLECSE